MRVTLEIPAEIEAFQGARARVIIERVRFADTRAEVVSEQFVENVKHQGSIRTQVPLEVNVQNLADRSALFIIIHIDLNGDDEVSLGDLLSQQSFRLPENNQDLTVIVEKVGQ